MVKNRNTRENVLAPVTGPYWFHVAAMLVFLCMVIWTAVMGKYLATGFFAFGTVAAGAWAGYQRTFGRFD